VAETHSSFLRGEHRGQPRRLATTGLTVFFTGLSGSGKSTIADALRTEFLRAGARELTMLDGDAVRRRLSPKLVFSREDRDLNILRIGFVAAEITKHGGTVVCAAIAPYDAARKQVRAMVQRHGVFVLVCVATPLSVCEARDPKGLYAKARAGALPNFTGISDPYEPPDDAEIALDTTHLTPQEAARGIFLYLASRGYVESSTTTYFKTPGLGVGAEPVPASPGAPTRKPLILGPSGPEGKSPGGLAIDCKAEQPHFASARAQRGPHPHKLQILSRAKIADFGKDGMVSECKPARRTGQKRVAPRQPLLPATPSAPSRPKDRRLLQAMRLIDSRLGDPQLSVTCLTQELKISHSRLRQLFSAELRMSPKSYIRERRLTHAASLLASSPLSVKEAMAAAGFNDPTHFAKDYKRRFGSVPSASREHLDAEEAQKPARLLIWPTDC
jgi:adenylyl-sulfate kinase